MPIMPMLLSSGEKHKNCFHFLHMKSYKKLVLSGNPHFSHLVMDIL